MTTIDIKFKTHPHDGTPGKSWEDFEERLMDIAAGMNDDRGWSLADALNRRDEGSAGGPAIVANNADGRKALAAYRKRQNDAYSLIAVHELDKDHRTHMAQNHFQNGPDAWDYLTALMREPVTLMQLREHDKHWNALDILSDVGVNPNTVVLMVSKIKAANAKRPINQRKDQTACTERLLELIFSSSKHFSESATIEYNAAAAARKFQIIAGPAAGQRDFAACTIHYHTLWKGAFDGKLSGFHHRAPAARPAQNTRTTLEAGLSMLEYRTTVRGDDERAFLAGGADFHIPRAGSPSRSLSFIAAAGDDLATRHGTTTTTD